MANATVTTYNLLKRYYTDQRVNNLIYSANPFLEMVPKDEKAGGSAIAVPVIVGSPVTSATFSTAQTNHTPGTDVQFLLTRAQDHSVLRVDNELVLASKGNNLAFAQAVTNIVDRGFRALSNSAAQALFGDGSGAVGQISSGSDVGTATITLATVEDIVHFEKDQVLVVSENSDGTSIRAGTVTVSSVDRDAGTITATGNWTAGISAAAAGDYIYKSGDQAAKMKGLGAWLPSTAPDSTSFFGVDRSSDPVRLGGIRYDGSSESVREAIYSAAMRAGREGGAPDTVFLSFTKFGDLIKDLGSQIQYTGKGAVSAYASGVTFPGPQGDIKVFADRNCPNTVAYLLQMDTWRLYSLGKVPFMKNIDGNKELRTYNDDSVEIRLGYYAQLGCSAPGWNARITLAS